MKPFIRIGTLYLNTDDILNVQANETRYEPVFADVPKAVPCVRITTRELKLECGPLEDIGSTNVTYDFDHGTPEATAIINWLESQSEILC
jgi:hypothetical protein